MVWLWWSVQHRRQREVGVFLHLVAIFHIRHLIVSYPSRAFRLASTAFSRLLCVHMHSILLIWHVQFPYLVSLQYG
jgi:hypothetical protein